MDLIIEATGVLTVPCARSRSWGRNMSAVDRAVNHGVKDLIKICFPLSGLFGMKTLSSVRNENFRTNFRRLGQIL